MKNHIHASVEPQVIIEMDGCTPLAGGGSKLDVTFLVQYYRRPARIPALGKSLQAFAAVGEHEVRGWFGFYVEIECDRL